MSTLVGYPDGSPHSGIKLQKVTFDTIAKDDTIMHLGGVDVGSIRDSNQNRENQWLTRRGHGKLHLIVKITMSNKAYDLP